MPHTITKPGKRVRVALKDGTVFVAKFRERTKRWLLFDDHASIRPGDVRSFSDYRGNTPRGNMTKGSRR